MINLHEGVKKAYSAAAEKPKDKHPFPVGRAFAESIGYPKELLDSIPSTAVDAFTGVSNVSIFADLPSGSTVLDLGCGAGLDTLIAAKRVGVKGKVIGVDFSESMISRARQAFAESGFDNVEFYVAEAEKLPIEDSTIDVTLINGIFNLNPKRDAVFHELARVVRRGGAAYTAELILKEPKSAETVCDLQNWFTWIAGAKDGDSFLNEFREAGFKDAVILKTSLNDRTKNPAVTAADIRARK